MNPPFIGWDVYARMTDPPRSYVRHRHYGDGTVTETVVEDGVVVNQRILPISGEPQQVPPFWSPMDPIAEAVAQAAADFYVSQWNKAMAAAKAAMAQAVKAVTDAQ